METRSVVVGMRLTPQENARLLELARRTERTPSDVLRRLLALAVVQETKVAAVALGESATATGGDK
jgi:predicted transcriptional regulator